MSRDISEAAYRRKLKEHGFVETGVMGYVQLPGMEVSVYVSTYNAGPGRRAKLAYLLQELEQWQARRGTGV